MQLKILPTNIDESWIVTTIQWTDLQCVGVV